MKNTMKLQEIAEVRILMLNSVKVNNQYPSEWFDLNDMENDYLRGKISPERFNEYLVNLKKWFQVF